jgi:hypothetical protein
MITRWSEPDDAIVGVEVSEKLAHDDFVALQRWVGAAVAKHRECGLVVVLSDFHGWNLQSLWDDIEFHWAGCNDITRLAYVGDKTWEHAAVALSRPITRSPLRFFEAKAIAEAKAWVAGDAS